MTRRSIRKAYAPVRPDIEAKERMLHNILSSASEIPPAGKDEPMKKRKIWRIILIAAAISLMACSAATATELIRIPVHSKDVFISSDGTIEFVMDIDEEVSGEYMPILEVVPHQITPEEAKRVAYAIFGDADYYEKVPDLAQYYTKAEIRQKLDRWSQYTTEAAVEELYGQWKADFDVVELVNTFIERYREKYETAPEEIPYTPCEWTFKNGIEYEQEEDRNLFDPDNFNDQIWAQLYVGDIPYNFCASNRDKDDFKVNNIYAVLATGISPNGIDEEIFKARMLRTGEPTQVQLDTVKTRAEEMLAEMDLGSWQIDQCYVEELPISEDVTEYTVHVTAVPILNGIPAVRLPQFTALRDAEDPTVSNYYYADVRFEFSANGDLISFLMYSPVEIAGSMENTGTLSVEQLLEKAKEYLTASSHTDYSFLPSVYSGEDVLRCRISVKDLNYNLTRTTMEGYTHRFCYVPGITVMGTVEYYEEESGEVRYSNECTLLTLDGRDGSLIGGVIE